jgi:PKD repeat protein
MRAVGQHISKSLIPRSSLPKKLVFCRQVRYFMQVMRQVLFILALMVCLSRTGRADVAVLTHHNDLNRTGANLNETVLTTNNVKTSTFGLVFSRTVDDQIYAQPLVQTNVNLGANGYHNLVIVATVNDSVYAFDADNPAVSAAYWHRTFLSSGVVPPSSSDMLASPCGSFFNISGNIGILSTPVIDPVAGTIYVLARTRETTNSVTNFVQRLHALDITTGLERSNSPVLITATVPGTNSVDSTNGVVTFNPFKENQRCGLALVNGVVYICWASLCDWSPYHGWMIGYDASTLQQAIVYNTTPNGDEGGIWMSGGAPAADTNGNIYVSIGNGTVGTTGNPSNTINRGESFIKFTPSGTNLTIDSWFTPYNWPVLETNDWDLGAAELLLIPGTNLAFSGGKGSVLYLVNRDNMGGFSATNADTNIIQSFSIVNKLFGGPVWWDGPANSYGYVWPVSDYLRQYSFSRAMGMFSSTTPFAESPATTAFPGGILSISANGSQSGTGILWAAHSNGGSANGATVPGILEAYNAENVATLLWSSQQNSGRDAVGNFAKFCPPTVVNGKVYLATFSSKLNVYGLLSSPQLSVSPSSLGFGTVAIGQTNLLSIQVQNAGGSNLTGTVTVSAPFAIQSGSPFSLQSGLTGVVQITFNPASSGSFSNNLIFTSNGGNSTDPVTGTGAGLSPAQLAVSPASLSFGTIAVGNSVQATFAITNLGGIAITNGTAIVGAPFAIVSGSPFNLAGFAGANVVVSCTPTDTGTYSNNVTFTSNGGNSTNAVTGSGTPPAQLAVSPASISFGTLAVGNTVQASFAITNLGGIAITNGTVVVNGPFAIVSGSPFTLPGFAASNVAVSFTPTNSGNFSNNVTFACNGGNSTNAVTGSGTPPAQLAVSPVSVAFGTVAIGNTVQASFAITNLGGIAITNGIVVVNPPFAIVSGSPFALPGFAASNVVISFAPTNSGNFSNNVTFACNGGNSTNAVTGSGTPPAQLAVSPASISFGTVAVGNTVQASFAITNLGGIAITNGTAIVGAPFAIVSGSPFALPGFAASNVVISFAPTNSGAFSNIVTFTSNGGNSANAVTGSGTPPAQLAVSPASVNFGTVAVGNTVQASFAITNLGGIAITNGTVVVNGPFAIVSGTPFTLAGFAASNVVVSCTPTDTDNYTNNVIFTSNGGNSTNAVTGTGALPPTASFSGSPTAGEWPLLVSFTNNSSGTITNAFWSFGDGANTNALTSGITHNYGDAGTNTVTLTVSGPVGTNTETLSGYIVVTDPPPVTLNISLSGNQVQLTWSEGTLQSASQATGAYSDLTNGSPCFVTPSNAVQFYRVRVR